MKRCERSSARRSRKQSFHFEARSVGEETSTPHASEGAMPAIIDTTVWIESFVP